MGGDVGNDDLFEACWSALKSGGRLVANAVTLDGEHALYSRHLQLGGELTRIDISTIDRIGGHRAFKPRMTVTQWVVIKADARADRFAMSDRTSGTLYLVGVGPGDPELLTLKAAKLLGSVPVVAYPTTGDGRGACPRYRPRPPQPGRPAPASRHSDGGRARPGAGRL